MGFLGVFGFGFEDARFCGEVWCAIEFANKLPRFSEEFIGEIGGVGTHVGNETNFVELLGQGHGLF